jgi:hypothetical protein
MAGSTISPTHSLLIVSEISSIASTSKSTVTATAYKNGVFTAHSVSERLLQTAAYPSDYNE